MILPRTRLPSGSDHFSIANIGLATNNSIFSPCFRPLAGRYSAMIQAGYDPDGLAPSASASLVQAGRVRAGNHSLQFKARNIGPVTRK